MPIISKETFEKFTQEEKESIRKTYQRLLGKEYSDIYTDEEMNGALGLANAMFPKEQLQPQPLTYKDVARELFREYKGNTIFYIDRFGEISESDVGLADDLTNDPTNCTSRKQAEKLLAINKLLNVAAYLNKNEDGTPWKPDWSDGEEKKFFPSIVGKDIRIGYVMRDNSSPAYFRTEQLVQQAIQILGEDTVRLTLTTDY